MSGPSLIIVALLLTAFSVIVEVMVRMSKLRRPEDYSYQKVVREGLRWCLYTLIVCLLMYLFTDSLEASLTIGLFLILCVMSGCIKILHTEYQIKKRGGQRV